MPPIERSGEFAISPLGDIVRIRFRRNAARIELFSVQLEISIEGQFLPVVRWDTAHGFAHRDHLDWNGETDHWDQMINWDDFNASLTEAINDAIENWDRYRSDFIRRRTKPWRTF